MDPAILLDVGENVLRAAKGYAAEVVVFRQRQGLTRFARSRIHQAVERDGWHIGLRLRRGQHSAVVWWTSPTRDAILHHVRQAAEMLRHTPPDPALPPLVPPREEDRREGWMESTARATAEDRAGYVRRVLETAGDLEVFGAVQTRVFHVALLNSENLRLTWRTTDSAVWVQVVAPEGGSGWAQASHPDLFHLEPEVVARRAAEKAWRSRNPRDIPPGDWPVILEPLAVADLFTFLGWIGFSARAVEEKASCFLERFGQKIWDRSLTLVDRPLDGIYRMPFDMEGIPKANMILVERGVIRGPVLDLRTAQTMGRVSTGHAMTFFGDTPFPAHMHLQPGDVSREDLIRKMERALLVTRFHYVNVTDPREGRLTGMTRDGTFLVEGGEVVAGVKNLRFHVSLIEVFREVVGVSRETEVVAPLERYDEGPPVGGSFPTLVLPRFHFASGTVF